MRQCFYEYSKPHTTDLQNMPPDQAFGPILLERSHKEGAASAITFLAFLRHRRKGNVGLRWASPTTVPPRQTTMGRDASQTGLLFMLRDVTQMKRKHHPLSRHDKTEFAPEKACVEMKLTSSDGNRAITVPILTFRFLAKVQPHEECYTHERSQAGINGKTDMMNASQFTL